MQPVIELPEWAQHVQLWIGLIQPIFVPLGVVAAGGLAAWVATRTRREETRHKLADGKAEAVQALVSKVSKAEALSDAYGRAIDVLNEHRKFRDSVPVERREDPQYADVQEAIRTQNERVAELDRAGDEFAGETHWPFIQVRLWVEPVTYKLAEEVLDRIDQDAGAASIGVFGLVASQEVRATRESKKALREFVRETERDLGDILSMMRLDRTVATGRLPYGHITSPRRADLLCVTGSPVRAVRPPSGRG